MELFTETFFFSTHYLCLINLYRNWLAGRSIYASIVESIQRSRKTVLVLSNHFAKSVWCEIEMSMAQHQLFQRRYWSWLWQQKCHRFSIYNFLFIKVLSRYRDTIIVNFIEYLWFHAGLRMQLLLYFWKIYKIDSWRLTWNVCWQPKPT